MYVIMCGCYLSIIYMNVSKCLVNRMYIILILENLFFHLYTFFFFEDFYFYRRNGNIVIYYEDIFI